LSTIAGIVKESARVYRMVLNRHVTPDTGARLIYMLTSIRASVESMQDRERPTPPVLEAPTIVIQSVPSDHYLSAEQVRDIRESEYRAEFGSARQ
jgi:hypothetical protein